jgi:dCMP deaminase
MIDKRVSWDEYFMQQCDLVASRSTCDRKHVGAVIVKDKRIVATGYNGSLPGTPHCSDPTKYYYCPNCKKKFSDDEVFIDTSSSALLKHSRSKFAGCTNCLCAPLKVARGGHDMENNSCWRTVHAEVNAVAQTARMGISTEGAVLYCNAKPCWRCFQIIVSAGIKEIVYREDETSSGKSGADRISQALEFGVVKFRKFIGE